MNRFLDTTNELDARAKDKISTALLTKYFGAHNKYPKDYEGIIVRALGTDAYEADLVVKGDDIITLRFGGGRLNTRSIKLPARDLNEKNII